jgi:hypothetical protein
MCGQVTAIDTDKHPAEDAGVAMASLARSGRRPCPPFDRLLRRRGPTLWGTAFARHGVARCDRVTRTASAAPCDCRMCVLVYWYTDTLTHETIVRDHRV